MRSGREDNLRLMVNGSGCMVNGEWFFSEAGFCFLKVWISVRIGSDGGRQMVEVYFRPAA